VPLLEEFWDNLLAYAITVGAAGAAVAPLFFLAKGRRLLPMQRLRKGNWSGREVWLAFLVLLAVPDLSIGLLDSLGFYDVIFDKPPTSLRMSLWASPLAMLLRLAIVFWLLFQASRTRPSHLGLTIARWPQNSILGYLSFLALTPIVQGSYVLVVLLFNWVFGAIPEDHQLKKISEEHLAAVEWILLFGEAIISAPLLEELLFRGVLQGWLRRASFSGHVVVILVALGPGLIVFLNALFAESTEPAEYSNAGPLIFTIAVTVIYAWMLYRKWTSERKSAVLAIFGSAMLFAVAHSNVWPTPLPLLLLGIGLGFLAYRTQNLLPGIVVHSLFNTVTCIELVLGQINN
jgi:membrane protease YdiL (CAAX protease family)